MIAAEELLTGANIFVLSITTCIYIETMRLSASNVALVRVREPHNLTNELHGLEYAAKVDEAT